MSYFNTQSARKPGLRTTSHGWVSTYSLSQNAGRVINAKCRSTVCLSLGAQSKYPQLQFRLQLNSRPPIGDRIYLIRMVGAGRFERPTPCAQGRCATRLRYAPTFTALLILKYF